MMRLHDSRRGTRAECGRRGPQGQGTAGLTLVEVLISIALSSILLLAVYSAITMYFQYSSSGQEEIARNQLARVLIQRIEQDLRSIVYREEDAAAADGSTSSAPTDSAETDTGTETQTTTTEITDPSEAFAGSASGLFGDAQTVVLHISRPQLDALDASLQSVPNAVSRTSDLKTVSYFVAGSGGGGLQAAAASQFAIKSPDGTGQSQGLARMEGDRLALQLADKSGDVASLLGQTQLLAPEVSRIAFRYFDGTQWMIQWDSASYGGLPRAVEVTLELTFEAQTVGRGLYRRTRQQAPRTYRSVVFLPVSKPILTTTSSSSTF